MEVTDDQSLPPPRPQRCVRRQTLFFFLVKSDHLPSQAQDQCKMTLKNGGFRFVSFRFVSFRFVSFRFVFAGSVSSGAPHGKEPLEG
jgi:hypothetical protein